MQQILEEVDAASTSRAFLPWAASLYTSTYTPVRDPAEDVSHFKEHGGQVLVGTPGRIDDVLKRCPLMDTRRLEVRANFSCAFV